MNVNPNPTPVLLTNEVRDFPPVLKNNPDRVSRFEGVTIQLSQAGIRNMEAQMSIVREFENIMAEGEGSGDWVRDLSMSFERANRRLNPNSENSRRHWRYLENAFSNMTRFWFMQEAAGGLRPANTANLRNSIETRKTDEQLKEQREIFDRSQKDADTFLNAFLRNLRPRGFEEAFGMAIALIRV